MLIHLVVARAQFARTARLSFVLQSGTLNYTASGAYALSCLSLLSACIAPSFPLGHVALIMPPRVPILAQSENKSRFLERLGLSNHSDEGKRVYAMMKVKRLSNSPLAPAELAD